MPCEGGGTELLHITSRPPAVVGVAGEGRLESIAAKGPSERATSRWRVPDSAPSRRIDDIGCVYCHEAESPRLKKAANPCIRDYLFDEAFDEAGVPRWTEFAYQGTAIRYTEENVG